MSSRPSEMRERSLRTCFSNASPVCSFVHARLRAAGKDETMKSRLFQNNEDFKADSFKLEPMKKDMTAMMSIADDKLPAFMKAVRKMLLMKEVDLNRVAEKALPQLGIERPVFDLASNVAGWLASEFYPEGNAVADAPEAIVDDMIELKLISDEQKARCGRFVRAVKALVQEQMQAEIEKERALQKGAPKVIGVETAVFFRNVFKKDKS